MRILAKLLSLTGLALLSAGIVTDAKAVPTLITTLDLAAFPPYGDGTVQTEINDAITAWNAAYDPDLPTTGIGATPNFKATNADFGSNLLSINLTLGDYNYVFLHWGGPDVDASYANPQLYYIGADSGVTTFSAPWNTAPDPDKQYGLSFYSFYSPRGTGVPDGGATLALLGAGMLGVVALRRRLSK